VLAMWVYQAQPEVAVSKKAREAKTESSHSSSEGSCSAWNKCCAKINY